MQAGPFQLALGFGRSPSEAEETARKQLRRGEAATRAALEEGWRRQVELPALFGQVAGDGGDLGRASLVVLRALEDKAAPGAFVAASAAPPPSSSEPVRRLRSTAGRTPVGCRRRHSRPVSRRWWERRSSLATPAKSAVRRTS